MKPPRHRTLPTNIRQDRWSFIVDIRRAGRRHVRHFPKSRPDALALALECRNQIISANPLAKVKTTALSNTGLVGISESVQWVKNYAFPCFKVSWYRNRRRTTRQIIYGRKRPRAVALKTALRLRTKGIS